MKDGQKFLSGFILGAAAGAVITTFLQGEKGKALVKNVKSNLKDAAGDLRESIENIDTTLEKWVNKGRSLIDEIRKKNNEEDVYDYEEIFS
ncbi:hypothetical protein A9P82_13090 [Arachidicoccus ginsenosidimutans]|uniref:YtxH domain-containing protein n=1 Tax=Arachidicoccus sp. BS20 TaxID=1850526 RepID=UPI0007F0D8AE|nr:YtxH domain-containing protein [Arachidicoccus sp. BS20]ANI90137.1 hypothetical protein A9P82_13090 [Arachidicoccus sp. BS20]